MTNHPNRSRLPISSIARNAYPGDNGRIMKGAHCDTRGNWWENGTEYEPDRMGADNVRNRAIQVVRINGREVEFDRGRLSYE